MHYSPFISFTKKKVIYAILPVVIAVILFPQVFVLKGAFIAQFHDILQLTMPYHFHAENPGALWNNMWIAGFPDYAGPILDIYYPLSFPFSPSPATSR